MALKKIPRKQYSFGSCGSYTYQCDIVHRDKLFPSVLKHLMQGDFYQNQIEEDGVIVVQDYRIHGNYKRTRTLKFKKIW